MRRFQLTTVHMCLCVTKVCVREGVSQRPAARHALQDEPKTIDFQRKQLDIGWRARARTDTGQNRHRNTAHVTLVAHELSSETSAQSGRTGPPARSKHPAEIPTAASARTQHTHSIARVNSPTTSKSNVAGHPWCFTNSMLTRSGHAVIVGSHTILWFAGRKE